MKYLIALSLGPVQEFIAAARRTADLWAGSQLLVTLASAAAKALETQGAVLIFPVRDADGALTDGPNKILAEVEAADGAAVARMAEAVKRAVRDKLLRQWRDAETGLKPDQRGLLDADLAAAQIAVFLEAYAAWAPIVGGGYAEARKTVERLLAGRKALRDFAPPPTARSPRAKSPLDPSFDFVFDAADGAWGSLEKPPLRLKKTETLDAVSVLKRINGAAELTGQIPHTRTLARRATDRGKTNDKADEGDEEALPQPPFPYFAILVADGDRMGVRIEAQDDAEAHRDLSRRLAGFAREATGIVSTHDGFAVYAGGDDVLAFVPVPRAIGCARALAETFTSAVGGGATLSVGVAIVHYMEPLRISLERARAAEKAAKVSRNALAVALHTRGGGNPITVTTAWITDRYAEWQKLVDAYKAKRIGRGLPYELANLAGEWEGLPLSGRRLHDEAERICKRKEAKFDLPDYATDSAAGLLGFAEMMTVVRFLTGERAAAGPAPTKEEK